MIVAKVTFAVVATSCPIATSFAFTVTPVPCPTAKVLSDANVPPPVKPSPAVKVLPCKVSTLPSSVVILVEKLALAGVNEPLIFDAIWAELDNAPLKIPLKLFAVILPLAVIWPFEPLVHISPPICKDAVGIRLLLAPIKTFVPLPNIALLPVS